ncbi:FAD-dependent oxidoreductase [Aeromicrobium sp. SMF47]|uniref:FAD-dependent oxidoreductase n=1 Tax=Aeromicrobium yanjiei TaxID=2662028 RepID=A0A5Q2MET5_9ACTN|nr:MULTISPECIES: FAD-dependent oxidoreductase [Aeromicrobium]MRJ75255.1 FAD-dependent oxidoreductase [Aeromicrobium yanjiei]MRK02687.1 FAD-dependent oxidoreductase [Aeromicrobium sp. S22]QGG40283.1 FAD-dependent oxidoreductase [Aeromicrobium yanjiei]
MKPATSSTTSLWLDRPEPIAGQPLPAGDHLDDIVVGAGITGLTTALLLARAGRRVAVLEAGVVGSLASGNTTAKVSLLQGTKMSTMLRYQSQEVVRAYVDGNLEGQQWMLRFCDDHGVPYQLRDAVTYASAPEQAAMVDQELEATQALGLPTFPTSHLDVPFPQFGAVVLRDQAQIDPMDLLTALVEQIRSHGGSVHQGVRVVDVSWSGRRTVTLEDGATLQADHVVLATGFPILDRGLYFSKLEPMRSYALAYDAPAESVPDGMYLSAGPPSRSVRDVPTADGRRKLLIGGSGHEVGRTPSERAKVDALREWTAEHFPGAVETHAWSAQDYQSHDAVPYIGPLPRGGGRIHVATGFDKWGMASGVMAGRSISAQILDEAPSWQKTMSTRVTRPSGIGHVGLINAKVAVAAAKSLASAEMRPAPAEPAEGEGVVGRRGIVPVGTSTVDGTTCAVRAICTHVGGVLSWNDNDKTYDCPLHGSRFAADGTVIEGPAVRPLKRLEPEEEPS